MWYTQVAKQGFDFHLPDWAAVIYPHFTFMITRAATFVIHPVTCGSIFPLPVANQAVVLLYHIYGGVTSYWSVVLLLFETLIYQFHLRC